MVWGYLTSLAAAQTPGLTVGRPDILITFGVAFSRRQPGSGARS